MDVFMVKLLKMEQTARCEGLATVYEIAFFAYSLALSVCPRTECAAGLS
jgi:hypothetical protein